MFVRGTVARAAGSKKLAIITMSSEAAAERMTSAHHPRCQEISVPRFFRPADQSR
ncbi:hypothetical protein GP2143_12691 [marine gamma proteobacterium HTCC2143]|uniref:Uncharacterized protein n=1 Tax=marine gamma proteobacterium HTCC2143 TaxID=247633 RepID=A0Y7K8_9GAMM|nr:hypothetical protein GP2143_12691 [marine gamma proteobacterium HTCC2143]